jgi:hypothetical protein
MVRYLRPLAACLALTVALLPGCAASRPRNRATEFVEHLRLNTHARMAARGRLQAWNWPQHAGAGDCTLRVRLLREEELTAGL